MDLQPQPPALPPPQPAPGPTVTAGQRIKRKHKSLEAEAAAEAAPPEEGSEPLAPVRTSVRVKLRRSGSASKQPASSTALSGKQMSEALGKRRHKHRHRPHAVPGEGAETLTHQGHGSDAPEAGMASSRMHSSSGPGYGHQLTAHPSAWQSGDQQAEPVDARDDGVNSQGAADVASGHSKSEEMYEDSDQGAGDTEAASGRYAEHAETMLSHGQPAQRDPAGDEQGAGQSHVTGPPHSQAQQGGFQMPLDTAHSDLNQHEHPGAFSMTESTAGADAASREQAGHPLQEEGMPSTQAFQMGASENGPAAPKQYGKRSTHDGATQGGEDSEGQDWLHSSSAEVASPQQPLMRQAGNEGSKSVDQMPPQSHGATHGADGDRAESQLRASRQLKQPK